MNYQQVEEFLFSQLVSYQHIGNKAFNKSLDKTLHLLEHLGNPHKNLKFVHVAGTNGKGSSCHMISSILQEAGYKVGLYTSPHLKKFTERIKINGIEADEQFVLDFVINNKSLLEDLKPSFFEITTVMAFQYFYKQNVDIAIIETGLGGRLDSTNVIRPMVSLITTIGLDHQNILGDTIEKIAFEKAGIIKENTPVVLGIQNDDGVEDVVVKVAKSKTSNLIICEEKTANFKLDLKGEYQQKNLPGILNVINILNEKGIKITHQNIELGLKNIIANTGLKGRWQKLLNEPLIICDTVHNTDGIKLIVKQISKIKYDNLFIVIGMVEEKDIDNVLSLLPKDASYVFTQGENQRMLPAINLKDKAKSKGLEGVVIEDVNEAIDFCKEKAKENDFIFVGGSTFVVSEIESL